jgi:hypothetical protein
MKISPNNAPYIEIKINLKNSNTGTRGTAPTPFAIWCWRFGPLLPRNSLLGATKSPSMGPRAKSQHIRISELEYIEFSR